MYDRDEQIEHSLSPPVNGMIGYGLCKCEHIFEREKDRIFLWYPVFFGLGIGLYFACQNEPSFRLMSASLIAPAALFLFLRKSIYNLARVLAAALLCTALGFLAGKLRTEWVRGPQLQRKLGPVELTGWIEYIERRQPRGHRLTIHLISLDKMAASQRPIKVRLTTLSQLGEMRVGQTVKYLAILHPPPEPALPGGYDFARRAWFQRIGAVGYTISKPDLITPARGPPWQIRWRAAIEKIRHHVDQRLREVLPGQKGAIASALITGKRGAIDKGLLVALREAGLAHILAISGLHMAMIAGAIFWGVRALLALSPFMALTFPIKKWAAIFALLGGGFYLLLSGAAISTERAFIMISIMFLAILLARPALTLRNVALAALVVLVLFPEAVLDVGFQMSFAAVIALISAYEELRKRRTAGIPRKSLFGILPATLVTYFSGILFTTFIATLAVAPFAIFHFHKLAHYSLVANLLAMPVVALIIMPMALVSLLALPFSLEIWPLTVMAKGIDFLLDIAITISHWDGAVSFIPAFSSSSLLLIVGGGLWLCLWQENWRLMGALPISLGLILSLGYPQPDILVGREGKTIAVRSERGDLRLPLKGGHNFTLQQWLKADGDKREVKELKKRGGALCDSIGCTAVVQGKLIALVTHPAALMEDCLRADIVIIQMSYHGECPKARLVIDRNTLREGGAHAIFLADQSIHLESVAARRGDRPWTKNGGMKKKWNRRTRDLQVKRRNSIWRPAIADERERP